MTQVKVFRKGSDDCIMQIIVEDHTGFAKKKKDIVCSGISAIIQTAILGLQKYLPQAARIIIKNGYVEIKINKPSQESNIILETAILGLLDIEKDYKKYISVSFIYK